MADARPSLSESPKGVRVPIKVMPRGSRDAIVGVRDGRLCIRTTAPPVDGAANARVTAFLAKALGFRKSAVSIDAGERSREKQILIAGVSLADVSAAIDSALGDVKSKG